MYFLRFYFSIDLKCDLFLLLLLLWENIFSISDRFPNASQIFDIRLDYSLCFNFGCVRINISDQIKNFDMNEFSNLILPLFKNKLFNICFRFLAASFSIFRLFISTFDFIIRPITDWDVFIANFSYNFSPGCPENI